ncbi:MAG: rhodanese-like domain-containing protein [Smithellaceae bacterium]|jgi:rhodanese-related sulfurtransferase
MTFNNILSKLYPTFREGSIILAVALFIAVVFNLIRPAGINIFGFSSAALIREQQAIIPEISLWEAYSLYLKNKGIFIDARDPLSFEDGHINGAINIYPDEASFHASSLKVKADQGFIFITYCDGPQCPLSKETAHELILRGIPTVKILVNGWGIWLKAGYPISKGKK